jgi:tetratricopeptide (TPR) repeat protein
MSVAGSTNDALVQLHSQILSHLNAGSSVEASEAYRLCLKLPVSTPETRSYIDHILMITGLALEKAGDLDRSGELYRQLMRDAAADPVHRSNAFLRYGYICASSGKLDQAREACGQAIALNAFPEFTRLARQELTGILLLDQRCEEALPHLEVLLADPDFRDPPRLAFHLWYGISLWKTGRFDREQHASLLAGLPSPGSHLEASVTGLWTYLACLLEADHAEISRQLYLHFLEMKGISDDVITNCHFRLGLVCEALADWDAASRFYRQAMDAGNTYPPAQALARFRLAEILYLSEEYHSAIDLLSALGSSPELSLLQQLESHLRFGVCLLRTGKIERAQKEFELCRQRPGAAASGFEVKSDLHLAELFENRGEREAARECYRRVIHNPTSEPLTKAAALTRMKQIR